MMASDTLTEMESAASSMLNGPSSFSETWYRASGRGGKSYGQEGQGGEAHDDEICQFLVKRRTENTQFSYEL